MILLFYYLKRSLPYEYFVRDRALKDPDKQLRQWAQEQLKMQN
jgi:hypothetical protein